MSDWQIEPDRRRGRIRFNLFERDDIPDEEFGFYRRLDETLLVARSLYLRRPGDDASRLGAAPPTGEVDESTPPSETPEEPESEADGGADGSTRPERVHPSASVGPPEFAERFRELSELAQAALGVGNVSLEAAGEELDRIRRQIAREGRWRIAERHLYRVVGPAAGFLLLFGLVPMLVGTAVDTTNWPALAAVDVQLTYFGTVVVGTIAGLLLHTAHSVRTLEFTDLRHLDAGQYAPVRRLAITMLTGLVLAVLVRSGMLDVSVAQSGLAGLARGPTGGFVLGLAAGVGQRWVESRIFSFANPDSTGGETGG